MHHGVPACDHFVVVHGTQEGACGKGWLTFCIMFRTTTSEDCRVGSCKGDTKPGDLAAVVAHARIPEVGEGEAEPCVSNLVVI